MKWFWKSVLCWFTGHENWQPNYDIQGGSFSILRPAMSWSIIEWRNPNGSGLKLHVCVKCNGLFVERFDKP